MGVVKHFSSSSADRNKDKSVSIFSHWSRSEDSSPNMIVNSSTSSEYESLPNPRPDNYKILKSEHYKNHLIIKIKYLDCINYEGVKILVFENVKLEDLLKQKLIDPHFSENKNFISPVARFEPTDRGWNMAISFINSI